MKVYGPYLSQSKRGGGRRFVIRIKDDGSRKTTSYARHLMEEFLGYELPVDVDVDHIDRNPLNDVIENLRVLPAKVNRSIGQKGAEYASFHCAQCGSGATKLACDLRKNRHRKSGPFCNKSCARQWQIAHAL